MKKAAVIDPRTPDDVKKNLAGLELEICPLPLTDRVSEPISGHPDIQIFIHNNTAFTHPHISGEFIKSLEKFGQFRHNIIALFLCDAPCKYV